MNLREIIYLILIGILIAAGAFLGVQSCNRGKVVQTLTLERDACRNAPIVVRDSIIHDTIRDTVWRRPKEVTIFVHDTAPAKYCDSLYADSYKYVKGLLTGKIDYEIHSKDCGVEIRFPNVILPIDYRTETKTIVLHDTIPFYKPMNHWILEGNLIGNSIQKFPNFDLLVSYSIKDRVKLNLGGEYNMYHGEAYFKAGIGIYLK